MGGEGGGGGGGWIPHMFGMLMSHGCDIVAVLRMALGYCMLSTVMVRVPWWGAL